MSPILETPPQSGQAEADEPARTSDAAPPPKPSKDAIFDLLRVRRRREVLRYLHENGREECLSTLAEHVAAAENDIAVEDLTYSQRKRVYIALYQAHLPKLADHGVVDYDGRDPVRLREPARWLLPYLYLEPGPADLDAEPGTGALASDDSPGPLARLRARVGALVRR